MESLQTILLIILYYSLGYGWLTVLWSDLFEKQKKRVSESDHIPGATAGAVVGLIIVLTIWLPLFCFDIYFWTRKKFR